MENEPTVEELKATVTRLNRRAQKAEALLVKYKQIDGNLQKELDDIISGLRHQRRRLKSKSDIRHSRNWKYYRDYWLKSLLKDALQESSMYTWGEWGNLIRDILSKHNGCHNTIKKALQ